MHDLLYEHQQELDKADLSHYALRLGLEILSLRVGPVCRAFARRVREDFHAACSAASIPRPRSSSNGERYTGPLEFDSFRAALDGAERVEFVCDGPLHSPMDLADSGSQFRLEPLSVNG